MDFGCKTIVFPGNQLKVVITAKQLGSGQFGTVNLGYPVNNPNDLFAVKIIDKARVQGKSQQLLINEIDIMSQIEHKNVVRFINATKTVNNFYLLMEYCNGGDVESFVKTRGGYLQEQETRLILRQLVHGLMAIKEKNVIHRDIKLANLLVNFPTLKQEQLTEANFSLAKFIKELQINGVKQSVPFDIKITDLGFARQVEEDQLAVT